ncbi:MAG: hypothetical protein V3V67_00280 [Myxococcota bacterium]
MAGEEGGTRSEIGPRLGADQPVGTLLFVLFVPSTDRDGEEIDHEYANPDDVDDRALAELRGFLHRLGRETNQGEVGIVVGDAYHGISEFDD